MTSDMFPGERELLAAAQDLTYVDTSESDAELLAQLPPADGATDDDDLVVTSLRIPLGMQRRLKSYAQAHDTAPSVLIREWIELHLSTAEEDRPILLADAMRALAQLRPVQSDAA